MPEGDVVYRAAKRLDKALSGKVLTGCDLRVPRYATVDLSGQPVHEVVSRGKHLLARIGDVTLHTHLKMEGVWHVYQRGQRWRRPGFTARAILAAGDVVAVGFSLGLVEVMRTTVESTAVGHLGPDLLGTDWDATEAVSRLSRTPDVAIGTALLDQRNLAGIGNIYRSEACYLERIDPRIPVRDVPNLTALVETSRRILTASALHPPRREIVYGKARLPCPRCGTTIISTDLGDGTREDRRIYLCPRCQGPAA